MHTFIIAEHPEFGKIRTVEKDGKIWILRKGYRRIIGIRQYKGCHRPAL